MLRLVKAMVRLSINANIEVNCSTRVIVGMTESSTTISMWPEHQHIATIGSAGHLVPGMIARVLKQDGSFGKEGEQGELIVQGPSLALGYLNNEAA